MSGAQSLQGFYLKARSHPTSISEVTYKARRLFWTIMRFSRINRNPPIHPNMSVRIRAPMTSVAIAVSNPLRILEVANRVEHFHDRNSFMGLLIWISLSLFGALV